ncbi:hypothetical protein AD947_16135 [Acetobacter tropicalis]|uniref:Uncharacterized protein n=1 Tax=Acetobacter tropicalis TaxID=104102 RepID=A0A149TQN6_9PROT|nr:hypothetical protein [Acetobacter tropicalis]KXV55427.1 hypothetical protein AD947_16135 [Acetobacter tropicalis]
MKLHFTIPDLAKASGLTAANIVMIMNNAPETLGDDDFSQGRGVARKLSSVGLRRTTLIGAVSKLGIGIIPSARLASIFSYDQPYGELTGDLPSNCDRLVSRTLSRQIQYSEDFRSQFENADIDDEDFLFMKILLGKGIVYEKKALHGDLLMEIVDNTLVYISAINLAGIQIHDPHYQASFKITSWEKGGYPNVIRASSVKEDELLEWQNERENALTRSTVNVSLAIREAFYRILSE